jgi:hypothetical protein
MGHGGQRPGVLRLREDLPWRQIKDAVIVLDLRTSTYFSVNRTGARLWSHLLAGATISELARALSEAEGVDPDRARADVEAFVADLERRAVLTR